MRPFKKKAEQPKRERTRNPQKVQRLHSYYTPSHIDKEVLDMSRTKKHRKPHTEHLLQGIFLRRLAILILIVFIVWTATILSDEPIISFSDNQSVVSVERYAQTIQGMLGSSVLNANKFTMQKSELEKNIAERFPELRTVKVETFVFGKKPVIKLGVYTLPISYSSNGKDYLIADNGVIVGEKSEFILAKNTISLRDESGIPVSVSDSVLRSDDVGFLVDLKKLIGEKGTTIEYAKIGSTPREVVIKPSGKNYTVKMSFEEDLRQQIGSWFACEKVVGEAGGSISEYIDVRAGEKVFYK